MGWDEFLDWAPDEEKSEWVDGEGIAYVSNSPLHIRLAFFFARLLELYVDVFDLGDENDRSWIDIATKTTGRNTIRFISFDSMRSDTL